MTPGIKLGWAFFGLLCFVVFAYALNNGIFVGSRIEPVSVGVDPRTGKPTSMLMKQCSYLYPSGIVDRVAIGEATNASCRLFASN